MAASNFCSPECVRAPEAFGSLGSVTSAATDPEQEDGRGNKHGALDEELQKGYKRYIGIYDSKVSTSSTSSSWVLQEITAEQMRTGCKKPLPTGVGTVASGEDDRTVQGTPKKNNGRNRYSSQWRGLKSEAQPARFKKVAAASHKTQSIVSPSTRQPSAMPEVKPGSVGEEGDMAVGAGASSSGSFHHLPSSSDPGFAPKAPTSPSTGRPQPGWSQGTDNPVLLGNTAARVNNAGKAYHEEMEKVEKMLEAFQADREDLTWKDCIGTGATARVFEGTWSRMPGQAVAIKQLSSRIRCSAQLKQEVALLREIAVTASIAHDHLVKFYGFTLEVQPYLLITEFCKGNTCFNLLHALDPIELTTKQQLKMCSDVARAMDYLHKFQPQIIHRDLKSLNLLLVEEVTLPNDVPHVKVSDFGLSKMKDDEAGWNKMTVEVGTPHWMAPEMAKGQYDEKVDIYSFAMVIFEIICNEIPFEDLDGARVLLTSCSGGRPDMQAIPAKTPAGLVELMQQCWAHNPSQRPSFDDIGTTLGTLNRSVGVSMSWGHACSFSDDSDSEWCFPELLKQ